MQTIIRRQLRFTCLLGLVTTALVSLTAASTGKLLIASDIHFNSMADPVLVPALVAADPAEWQTILQESKLTAFSRYRQDTNWWLLRSALDAMMRTQAHPTLVMFTGDMLAHNFPGTYRSITHDSDPEHYRSFVRKTVQFVALEFRKRYPSARILITPGNDDDECRDYSIEENGTFLSDTAAIARDLAVADDRFVANWKSLGSYSVSPSNLPGIRIVSLNSVFFSNKYRAASFPSRCTAANSNAAAELFAWLESELVRAQQAREKVWLMFHIPPGIDGWASTHTSTASPAGADSSLATSCVNSIVPMWVPEWTAKFASLLELYHDTVVASFAGHTHSDDFRIINLSGGNKEFVLIDPAVSPVYDQNPGFRIIDFNRDGTLADQSTYYLTNLRNASGDTRGRWRREYKFSKKWKAKQLNGVSLATIDEQVADLPGARAAWLRLYMVSSPAGPVPPNDVRGLYCAIAGLDRQAYAACACATPAETLTQ